MLELWGMWSAPSLPLLPGVVTHDRILSMSQVELPDIYTECQLMTYAKLSCLKKNYLII